MGAVSGMPEGSTSGMFENPPEQVPIERPVAAPRLRKAERRRVSLRPVGLEDPLPADHRARLVWAFAERLDLRALYGATKAVEGHPGLARGVGGHGRHRQHAASEATLTILPPPTRFISG